MWQISVILSQANLPQLVDYHCMRCTSLMFKSNRDIVALWMGDAYPAREIPKGMGWIQHKCRGCKMMYNMYVQ